MDYGYLGVTTLSLWPQLAERLELDVRTGALVQDVEQGSPAEEAGLKAGDEEIKFQGPAPIKVGGDVIVAVDGKALTRRSDLADVISELSAGDKVKLEVLRDDEHRTVTMELGRRPTGAKSGVPASTMQVSAGFVGRVKVWWRCQTRLRAATSR